MQHINEQFVHKCKSNTSSLFLGNLIISNNYVGSKKTNAYLGNTPIEQNSFNEQHIINLDWLLNRPSAWHQEKINGELFYYDPTGALIFQNSNSGHVSFGNGKGVSSSISGLNNFVFAKNAIVIIASNEMFNNFSVSLNTKEKPIITCDTLPNDVFVTNTDNSINIVNARDKSTSTALIGNDATLILTTSNGNPTYKSEYTLLKSNYVIDTIKIKFPSNDKFRDIVEHNQEHIIYFIHTKKSEGSSPSKGCSEYVDAYVYGSFVGSNTLTGTGSGGTKFQICIGEGPKPGGNYGYGAANNKCFIYFYNHDTYSLSKIETFSHPRISPNPFKITDKIVIN